MKRRWLAFLIAASCSASLALGDEPKPEQKGPGGFPRGKPAAKPEAPKKGPAPMAIAPAAKSGSMPTGPAPKGKLGTEPTTRGRLGTDPQPRDPKDRPPRFN